MSNKGGLIYMDEEEQKWWGETLRRVEGKIDAVDTRLRDVEQTVNNGLRDAVQRMSKILEELHGNQSDLRGRVKTMEDEDTWETNRKEIRWKIIRWATATALTAGALVFAALRFLTG